MTVADGEGGAAGDQVTVTMQDTTRPQVMARLVRITRSHDPDDDGDADDDDEGADKGKTLFRVVASATDTCHSSPGVQADINGVTVVDGQLIRVTLMMTRRR